MPRFLTSPIFGALILVAAPALAAPRVATDISAVHSLAAQVMEGVGAPDLIMPPGASPHGYSLRPSEAAALQDAEIVFWIGESLTPWLERSLETIAGDAKAVELLGAGESNVLETRESATFEGHDDHHGEGEKDAHDEHDDHDGEHADNHSDEHGDEHAKHEDDEHDGHDHHDHGGQDPHAWLDPENAKAWLDVMAASLSTADPANAGAYFANAAAAKTRLDAVSAGIAEKVKPISGARFIVFHDAYQYFETRFGVPAAGAISVSDAQKPSPARIAELQAMAKEEDISCVFAEPQFDPGIVSAVFGDTGVETGVIDPLGASLTPGPDFYASLLTDMADAMVKCLGGKS